MQNLAFDYPPSIGTYLDNQPILIFQTPFNLVVFSSITIITYINHLLAQATISVQ